MNELDIVLTGIPRSGTTLTCHLLNRLPQTVALAEPMDLSQFRSYRTRAEVLDGIARFFAESRASLLAEGSARTKHLGGEVPSNSVGTRGDGLRGEVVDKGELAFDKQLELGFTLVVKHPTAFTALLEDLLPRFPCFAVVRNPLSVLASWNTVQLPVGKGRAPAAEKFDPALARALDRIKDQTERQLHLLSWFFESYHRLLPAERVIRYEEMVATGGRSLQVITPRAELSEPLENQNRNRIYDPTTMRALGNRLLRSEGAYWRFYTRESVQALLG